MILIVSQEQSWVMALRAEQHCWVGGTVDPGTTDGAHETNLSSWVPQVSAACTVWGFSDRPRRNTANTRATNLVEAIFFFFFYLGGVEWDCLCVGWLCEVHKFMASSRGQWRCIAWINYTNVLKTWFSVRTRWNVIGMNLFLWFRRKEIGYRKMTNRWRHIVKRTQICKASDAPKLKLSDWDRKKGLCSWTI
jgi:hypothetical protein